MQLPNPRRRVSTVPLTTATIIYAHDLELLIALGVKNTEQFDNNGIVSLRFAFYITEDGFIESGVACSTVSDERYLRFELPI